MAARKTKIMTKSQANKQICDVHSSEIEPSEPLPEDLAPYVMAWWFGIIRTSTEKNAQGTAMSEMHLQIAQFVPCTEAEGPGRRFAIWLQGCPLRCAGCCNPEMLSFAGGEAMIVADLADQIRSTAETAGVGEGITLLGGEPMAHAASASVLAGEIQRSGLSVMVFSGFTLEEIRERQDAGMDALLAATDILVDGPYLGATGYHVPVDRFAKPADSFFDETLLCR